MESMLFSLELHSLVGVPEATNIMKVLNEAECPLPGHN